MPLGWLLILKNGTALGIESVIFLEATYPRCDSPQAALDLTTVWGHHFIHQSMSPIVRT